MCCWWLQVAIFLERSRESAALSSRPVFVPLAVAENVCGGSGLNERIFLSGTKEAAWKVVELFHCFYAIKVLWGRV